MTRRYYYLVEDKDLVQDMIKDSMISLGLNNAPTISEIIKFEENMRKLIDVVSVPEINYHIIKFEHIFFSSMVRRAVYSLAEIKIILTDVKWKVSADT